MAINGIINGGIKKNSCQEMLVEQIFEFSADGMLILSLYEETIVQVNQRACALLGYSKEEFLKLQPQQILGSKLDAETRQAMSVSNSVGKSVEIETVVKRATGSIMSVHLRSIRINDEQVLWTIRDSSETEQLVSLRQELSTMVEWQDKHNNRTRLSREVLKMIAKRQDLKEVLTVLCEGVEQMLDGVRVSILAPKDKKLYFLAAPSLPKEFTEQIEGSPVDIETIPCGFAFNRREEVLIENFETNKSFANCRALAKKLNICSCWAVPIFSASGAEVLGSFAFYSETVGTVNCFLNDFVEMTIDLAAVAIERDINRRKMILINEQYAYQNQELQQTKQQLEKDKARLLEQEQRLQEAQRLSKVGSWELDLISDKLTWSKQLYVTYNLEKTDDENLYIKSLERLHPDDVDILPNAILSLEYPNTTFAYEHRLVKADKSLCYVMGIGTALYNENKELVFVKGTEQDVTNLKLTEQRALENELKFNELMANINEVIFAVHINDKIRYDNPITYINGDTENIFGYTHQELIDAPILWTSRIHPDDQAHIIAKGEELHTTGRKVTREYRFKHKAGHYAWIEDNISITNVDGETRVYGSARDISQRKVSEAASLEIKERLELAKEAAKLGNYDWKITENSLHWDERMYEIFELDRSVLGLDKNAHVESILHPDDREQLIDNYMEHFQLKKGVSNFRHTYRIILSGRIKYIESYIILMRDEEGEIYRIIGSCLDVSDRKKAENLLISNEEKAVLLKEIHHRVKNNLQVITSLLSLQSNSLEDQDQRKIFADSQYRINSMAIVHELLYQSDNLSKLDYEDYLKKLSQYLIISIKGDNNNISLNLDVANIKLSIDTAIPLGLLINEVLTNSLKYGIKGANKGCISIRIFKATKEDNKKPSFILEIGDDGVGYPNTINYQNSKSLGLKLIHNLTRQLEGTIIKDVDKKGTNYIILFKEI